MYHELKGSTGVLLLNRVDVMHKVDLQGPQSVIHGI
jgi:hypothetical protein